MADITILAEKINCMTGIRAEAAQNGVLYAGRESILQILKFLRDECGYYRLADITAADYPEHYELVYHLLDAAADLLAVKVKLMKDNCTIPSAVLLWNAADAQEREVYDMFGIIFEGHGNLKRILCPDDFEGHPLRKDFRLRENDRFSNSSEGGRLNGITGRKL